MRAVLRFYQLINILSLDIVAGAVISALFFARILEVSITTPGLIALGLTVWIIYTADHLRDARRIPHKASTARHRFHQRHFKVLAVFLLLAIVMDAVTITSIKRQVLLWGLLLTPIILLYLAGQHYLRMFKELFIAILYTFGVLLLTVSVTTLDLNVHHYLMMLQFGILAWINLVLFSWFDYEYDQTDALKSLVTVVGRKSTERFLYFLFAAGAVITVWLYVGDELVPALVLTAMYMVLFFLFMCRNRLSENDAYRMIGDSVFLFPVFYLL